MLFMVADDRNSVVQYNAFDWNNIPVFSRDCYLFACLPGDEVAFISKEEFNRKLGTDNLNPLFTKTIQFKTERISTADFFKRITSDDQPTKTIAR
jgi:hypothetical protein